MLISALFRKKASVLFLFERGMSERQRGNGAVSPRCIGDEELPFKVMKEVRRGEDEDDIGKSRGRREEVER